MLYEDNYKSSVSTYLIEIGKYISENNIFEASNIVLNNEREIESVIYKVSDDFLIDHAKYLKNDYLINIIKGICIFENKRSSGSATRCPIYFHELVNRNTYSIGDVSTWIMQNCNNRYVLGEVDYYQLMETIKCKSILQRNNEIINTKSEDIDFQKSINRLLENYIETRDNFDKLKYDFNKISKSIKNKDNLLTNYYTELDRTKRSVRNLIKDNYWSKIARKAKDMSPTQRLIIVSNDNRIGASRFPVEWADVSDEVIKMIPKKEIDSLISKLERVRSGKWRNLYIRIKKMRSSDELF
jgi:hypothetical protein